MSESSALLSAAAAPDASGYRAWPMTYLQTAGPRADPATALTWGMIWLSLFVIALIVVLVAWGIWARRSPDSSAPMAGLGVHRSPDGLIWISIGLGLTVAALLGVLVWTIAVVRAVDSPASAPALRLQVTGHQWWWEVRYLGDRPGEAFVTANEIHIPVGRPILIELRAADVIHSFWVPALGGKTDTIPGRSNLTWLQADRPGTYRGQCAEFCGVQHARMSLFVIAQPPADFARWRRRQQARAAPAPPSMQAGQVLFEARCGACHTVRGAGAAGAMGPDLTHVMSRSTLAAGTLANTDANRLGWISNPQALKPGARMPATDLSAAELTQVEAYLETLR